MSNSFSMAIIFLLIITNIATFVIMNKQLRRMKDQNQYEALRAALWKSNFEELRFVLREKNEKILAEAGKEYVRRLKAQEERLREEYVQQLKEQEERLREELTQNL